MTNSRRFKPGSSFSQLFPPSCDKNSCPSAVPRNTRSGAAGCELRQRTSPPKGPSEINSGSPDSVELARTAKIIQRNAFHLIIKKVVVNPPPQSILTKIRRPEVPFRTKRSVFRHHFDINRTTRHTCIVPHFPHYQVATLLQACRIQ